MIGIVIVAHDKLATGFAETLAHIIGEQSAIQAVNVESDSKDEDTAQRIKNAVGDVNLGQGVVIVNDLHGASPFKLALEETNGKDRRMIYGANMSMLLKLAKSRHLPLHEAIESALAAGRKYIGLDPGQRPDDDRQDDA